MGKNPGMMLDVGLLIVFLILVLMRNRLSVKISGAKIGFPESVVNSFTYLWISFATLPFMYGALIFLDRINFFVLLAKSHLLDFTLGFERHTVPEPDTFGDQIAMFVVFFVATMPSLYFEISALRERGVDKRLAMQASLISAVYAVGLYNLFIYLMYKVAMKYF